MPWEAFFKADAPKGKRLRIRGIVSTEHRDLQGEVVVQAGLDCSPISQGRGWFNDNHRRETGQELGIPTKVWRTKVKGVPATAVEGYLLDTPEGRRVWTNARALAGTGRNYGFSVEGAILERDVTDQKRIVRSVARQIAITRCPVNPNTELEPIAKSLTAHMEKAVRLGAAFPGASGQPGQMGALVPQDLGRRADGHDDEVQFFGGLAFDWAAFARSHSASDALRNGRRRTRPRLEKSQAVAYVRARLPGATDAQIRTILAGASGATGA
jgi:hypothetical protein